MRGALSRARRLDLAWADRAGWECLRIEGWGATALRELAALDVSEIGRRLRVLPSELVGSVGDLEALQPVAGCFEIDGEAVYFAPRFPFRDGTRYSLLVEPVNAQATGGPPAVWTIERPSAAGSPTTEVLAIYPSVEVLPVNQLRLYVHFSAPMSEDWAARAVHLRRADNGEPLAGVFVERPELWDGERRRLTLLLDPGRIKRGLVPNQQSGYPLIEGVPVVVRIDAAFRDAEGWPIDAIAERRYEVGPAVRTHVDPARWRCEGPVAGSTDALRVQFERPLDHGLIERCLWVVDAAGKRLAGRTSVLPGEREWRFEPQARWALGRHAVMVDPRIEDLAGNSVARVFDRDVTRAQDAPGPRSCVSFNFTCLASTAAPPQIGHQSNLLAMGPAGYRFGD